MIRNSIKYLPYKDTQTFINDLKQIYKAATESEAENNLLKLQEAWERKYPLAVRLRVNHRENIKTFLSFPEEIWRIIYTTNVVESLQRQFRKVTKNRLVFPNEESLFKLLFLTVRGLSEKWSMPVKGWKSALSQFAILFDYRLRIEG